LKFEDQKKEEAVIGYLAQHGFEGIPAKSIVYPDAFTRNDLQIYYQAAHDLHRAGRGVSSQLIVDYINERPNLHTVLAKQAREAGLPDWMTGFTSLDTTIMFNRSAAVEFLNNIQELYEHRKMEKIGEDIRAGNMLPEDVIAAVQSIKASSRFKSEEKLSIRTFQEILNMEFDDSDVYFGDRIIAASQPVTILGPGGIGKSRLLLQLAICMITGRDFLDMPTRGQGLKWMIFQTENSTRRIKHDLTKMVLAMKLAESEIRDVNACLLIHTIESDMDTFMDLENPEESSGIASAIAEHNPTFVAFDPLNTFTSMELNSDKDMKSLLCSLSRIVKAGNPQRVPVVLHHSLTGKAGAAKAVSWDKASFGRNSKALFAWTRAQINLAPLDPERPECVLMACGKNNNGKMFPEMGIILDEGTGIYRIDPDFDAEKFRQDVGIESKKPKKKDLSPAEVAAMFTTSIVRNVLLAQVQEVTGCEYSRACDIVKRAKEAGTIIADRPVNPTYTKPAEEQA
jgi:hypothetical protein